VATVTSGQTKWSQDLAATLAALPLVVLLLPFIPGIVMSDGMKSLEILAVIEVLLLAVILPAIDGLLVRQPAHKSEMRFEGDRMIMDGVGTD
jgi:hypothetical protein